MDATCFKSAEPPNAVAPVPVDCEPPNPKGLSSDIANQHMLDSDRKNLGIIDTVIVEYGVKGEPKETTQKMISQVQKLMFDSELTLFEKVQEHELLKHKQTMAGLLIHKAAQVVGADVEAAITPLNTENV